MFAKMKRKKILVEIQLCKYLYNLMEIRKQFIEIVQWILDIHCTRHTCVNILYTLYSRKFNLYTWSIKKKRLSLFFSACSSKVFFLVSLYVVCFAAFILSLYVLFKYFIYILQNMICALLTVITFQFWYLGYIISNTYYRCVCFLQTQTILMLKFYVLCVETFMSILSRIYDWE